MKIALIGLGSVGQGLLHILKEKATYLDDTYNFKPEIVAVGTGSKGTLYHPDGLDIDDLLAALEQGHLKHYPDVYGLTRNWDIPFLIHECNADVMVECSPTNLQNAQPALAYCQVALNSGKHLVLANKGPIAVAYRELRAQAKTAVKHLLFEGTVMAGTPSIRLAMQALAGCEISEARGILNGTTNYILTQMEAGMSYADALLRAQQLGYAETDPSGDVDGWDAAGKGIILAAALFHKRLSLSEMAVQGITHLTPADIEAAKAAGERWKLIVTVTPEGGSVKPTRLPINHPLAGVSGSINAVTYTTDLLGEVTLIGPGAGRTQTGFALLSDLLEIARNPY
jgi:homoserine dehydrogenase